VRLAFGTRFGGSFFGSARHSSANQRSRRAEQRGVRAPKFWRVLTVRLVPRAGVKEGGAGLRLVLAGEFTSAANLLAKGGRRTREALLRLRAGERLIGEGRYASAEEQLETALDFYRSVRATRYVAHCEALLSATPASITA
jgi:hypothetical protein